MLSMCGTVQTDAYGWFEHYMFIQICGPFSLALGEVFPLE